MKNFYLSIIIPAYNEENRIVNSLDELKKFIDESNYNCEIIIVDDGSKDRTIQVVHDFFSNNNLLNIYTLIENKTNKGKGFAVRKGLEKASGEFILFTDADFSTPINECKKMIEILKQGYDIVIGSRALKDSNLIKRQNIIRMSMGKFFNLMVKLITKLEFNDTQCGFKIFTKDSKTKLLPYLKIDDFSFDVEILYVAKKLNLKIKEIPVSWTNSPNSKVKIIKDSLKMFRSLIKIRNLHVQTLRKF